MNQQDTIVSDGLPLINGGSHANGGDNNSRSERGKNEDRKIFVGGISYDVTDDDLRQHFGKFGPVATANVKFDRMTNRSRGFAFVEFESVEACQHALGQREQTIKNKNVEVKPAKSHENKKVFVGGIPTDLTEEELREHFEEFGRIEEVEWPTDKITKTHRNFAFIVFEDEASADRAAAMQKQVLHFRECDVKRAVPRNRRINHNLPNLGNFPGQLGGMQQQHWYNPGQWGPIPHMPPYGGPGGWNEWGYGNTGMNFYGSAPGGQSGPQSGAGGPTGGSGYGNQHGNYKSPRPRQYAAFEGQHVGNQH